VKRGAAKPVPHDQRACHTWRCVTAAFLGPRAAHCLAQPPYYLPTTMNLTAAGTLVPSSLGPLVLTWVHLELDTLQVRALFFVREYSH
jgi:hypothetical protein